MSAPDHKPRRKSPASPRPGRSGGAGWAPAVFFASAAEFRSWLAENHATAPELQVGFYKKSAGRSALTYPEAVDEALCFGWIDGILRTLDHERYTHRFTPRRPGSIWSNVNVGRAKRLRAAGRMHAAGWAAFAARSAAKTGIYSFERGAPTLPPAYRKKFRARAGAWAFFTAQAPWYQRRIIHKIVSAKREATRLRWLARAIAESAAGRRVGA